MRLDRADIDDEMELLLKEIPDVTSAPPHYQHPMIPMYAHHHSYYHHHASPSSSSSTSPQSPITFAATDRRRRQTLDLIACFQNLNLQSGLNLNLNANPSPNFDPYPFVPRRNLTRPTLCNLEESFILDGRNLYYSTNNSGRNESYNDNYISMMARDQNGCRLLQKRLEEGRREDVDLVFSGVIGCIADLMMNPFANYLVQKLMDVCTEDQRMGVVVKLTRDPSEIIRVSLNTHGARVVQKLIETLRTPQQIMQVVFALKPGFLNLSKSCHPMLLEVFFD